MSPSEAPTAITIAVTVICPDAIHGVVQSTRHQIVINPSAIAPAISRVLSSRTGTRPPGKSSSTLRPFEFDGVENPGDEQNAEGQRDRNVQSVACNTAPDFERPALDNRGRAERETADERFPDVARVEAIGEPPERTTARPPERVHRLPDLFALFLGIDGVFERFSLVEHVLDIDRRVGLVYRYPP